jgi:hypothetical protein
MPRPTPSARFALLSHMLMKGFFIRLLLPLWIDRSPLTWGPPIEPQLLRGRHP